MSSYFFIFNGPPKSGKSTLARVALRAFSRRGINALPDSFALPLKQFISALMGKPYSSIAKDDYVPYLHCTPREALISMFQGMKERHGEDILGNTLVTRNTKNRLDLAPTVVVVDDSGFEVELARLPRERTIVVRIIRPGFSFNGDIRGYVDKPDCTIYNDAGLDKAVALTEDCVNYALAKWKLL